MMVFASRSSEMPTASTSSTTMASGATSRVIRNGNGDTTDSNTNWIAYLQSQQQQRNAARAQQTQEEQQKRTSAAKTTVQSAPETAHTNFSRPGVVSPPPPRPSRAPLRPAAEIRAAWQKDQEDTMSPLNESSSSDESHSSGSQHSEPLPKTFPKFDLTRVDGGSAVIELEKEERMGGDQASIIKARGVPDRSISLGSAATRSAGTSAPLSRSEAFETAQRVMRPRMDSAPILGMRHERTRSHFSIPDVLVTGSDDEGNETRYYEVQFEPENRRMALASSPVRDWLSASENAARHSSRKQSPQQLTYDGRQKASARPPIITIVDTEGNSSMAVDSFFESEDDHSLAKFSFPAQKPSTSEASARTASRVQPPVGPERSVIVAIEAGNGNGDSNSSDNAPSTPATVPSESTSSKIGRRLRKASLPSLFSRKERDAANTAALRIMPGSPTTSSPPASAPATFSHEAGHEPMQQAARQAWKANEQQQWPKREPMPRRRSSSTGSGSELKKQNASKNGGHKQQRTERGDEKAPVPDNMSVSSSKESMAQDRVKSNSSSTNSVSGLASSSSAPSSPATSAGPSTPSQSPKTELAGRTEGLAMQPYRQYSQLASLFGAGGINQSAGVPHGMHQHQHHPGGMLTSKPVCTGYPGDLPPRPSSTPSLTKKEVKQRQKEEKRLIKEREKVDKMVRKHDEKTQRAQRRALLQQEASG